MHPSNRTDKNAYVSLTKKRKRKEKNSIICFVKRYRNKNDFLFLKRKIKAK